MDTIRMIPIEQLEHHPQNPRVDLGDLTELSDSIKAKGIMQNLTVVLDCDYDPEPDNPVKHRFYVVIGNRRLEAARMAGLKELPCAVAVMDKKEIMATMVAENMQRRDLSVYEQTQGIQTMLDLGFTEDQIGERTGLSRTTVRRRMKMAELDRDELKKACNWEKAERQITLMDFDRLARIDDVKKRNEVLKKIGTTNFEWELRTALREQAIKKNKPDVERVLKEANLQSIKSDERYNGKYEGHYDWKFEISDYEPGKKIIPKSDKPVFYCIDGGTVFFYTKAEKKKSTAPEKSEEEKAEEKRIADAWKQIKEDSDTARTLRREYADKLVVIAANVWTMFDGLMKATVLSHISFCTVSGNYKELFGTGDNGYNTIAIGKAAMESIGKLEKKDWPKLIRCTFDADNESSYVRGYLKEMPTHKENPLLDAYYDWLIALGYEMSDTEIALKDGTHECFGKASQ